MSDLPVVSLTELELSDELVAEYLHAHPNFFNQHPRLLSALRVTDNQRGTVSLVEKQLQLLRHKNHQLQEEITQLMSVANSNEKLFALYNDIYLALIDCASLSEILTCVEQTVVELLGLHSINICFAKPVTVEHSAIVDSHHYPLFAQRLTKQDYYLGRLNHDEQQCIYQQQQAGSAIMFALCDYQQNSEHSIAVVIINSTDAEHFVPQMDTLLISQFQKLLSKLISQQLLAG